MKKAKVVGKIDKRILKSRTVKHKWQRPLTVPIGPILKQAFDNKGISY